MQELYHAFHSREGISRASVSLNELVVLASIVGLRDHDMPVLRAPVPERLPRLHECYVLYGVQSDDKWHSGECDNVQPLLGKLIAAAERSLLACGSFLLDCVAALFNSLRERADKKDLGFRDVGADVFVALGSRLPLLLRMTAQLERLRVLGLETPEDWSLYCTSECVRLDALALPPDLAYWWTRVQAASTTALTRSCCWSSRCFSSEAASA